MGRPSVVPRKTPGQAKAKKKPIKVVYISNPMKVTTSAAKFRGLVQKLTGRDSNVAYMAATDSSMAESLPGSAAAYEAPRDPSLESTGAVDDPYKAAAASPFEVFDDAFTPQTLDGLPPNYEYLVGGSWMASEA
ncbi:uncharacterized protein LOC135674035 [Musa acuminata AAA Group]|uniref:uncharacterized protein LOC135638478 n=1 Tax=Musa acuminata AAA Group TaxID=214697 RepID=UPI0031DA102D